MSSVRVSWCPVSHQRTPSGIRCEEKPHFFESCSDTCGAKGRPGEPFPEDTSKTAETAQPSLQWSSSALSRFRSYCRMFRASAITPKSFFSTSTDIRPLVRLFSPQIKDLESIQRRLPMPLSKASRFLQCHAAVAVNGVEGYGDLSKNNSDSRVPLTFSRLFLRWTHGS